MKTPIATMRWRRLDMPGHDDCTLERTDHGYALHGTAVYQHPAGTAHLGYSAYYDPDWASLSGSVGGVIGTRQVHFDLTLQGVWHLNGVAMPGLSHPDLDFGFTPATNLAPLHRVHIKLGARVALPAAWLDVDAGTLIELPQTYERRGDAEYWYEAPTVNYRALLEFAPNGFVARYPTLWEAEITPQP
jgi:uncharacterized protein